MSTYGATAHRDQAIAGNTSTGILKIIALVFMMIDHMGKMLFPQEIGMRVIGRMAFPIYAWCIVVGFHYTKAPLKYLLRILISGLICQIPYLIALGHYTGPMTALTIRDFINSPNIFLTLFLGLASIWGIRDGKPFVCLLMPAAALIAAEMTGCDYGWEGVLLIILMYACKGSRASIAAVMISFCLFWGSNSYTVTRMFGISLNVKEWPRILYALLSPFTKIQTMAVLALPLILIRFKKNWKMPLWLSYTLYPLHLVILILLEKLFV